MIEINVPVHKDFLIFNGLYENTGIETTCQCGHKLDLQGKTVYLIFKGHSDNVTMWDIQYPFSCINCGICIGSLFLYDHK